MFKILFLLIAGMEALELVWALVIIDFLIQKSIELFCLINEELASQHQQVNWR